MTPRLLAPCIALLLAPSVASGGSPSHWPAEFETWPRGTPSQGWPDGPFLGNGNIGVSIGGSDGSITLWATVHGFWSSGNATNSSFPPLRRGGSSDDGETAPDAPPLGFAGCPAANCTLTVGLTVGAITLSSPEFAGGSWRATQWLDTASAAVTLTSPRGAELTVTVWVTAADQLAVVSVVNTGGLALTAPLNLTTFANNNVRGVPITTGCVDGGGAHAPCPPPGAGSAALPGAWLRKDANAGPAVLPITGVLATRVLPLPGGGHAVPAAVSTAPFRAVAPAHDWVTGATVDTLNLGTTSMVAPAGLAPRGGGFVLAVAVCASADPLVVPRDPADAAAAWLAAVDAASGVTARWQEHTAWWARFWNASAIDLDAAEAATEAFWYTALYALGSGSRPGQLVMDLWSPWRTTDYPKWRSNPTMDYNAQAVVAAASAVNHPELAAPFFDFLSDQLARGGPQLESAALGCPGGAHASVDLAPWGLKMGVWGEPQDWGILSNAAYAGVNYLYQFYSTPLNTSWVDAVAWPWLSATAVFWTCTLVKTPVPGAPDGYLFFDPCDCNGDEGCSLPCADGSRSNPMWAMTYVRRLLTGLGDIAAATGRTAEPAWADVLAHLPPLPTTRTAAGEPVLAWYGSGGTNWAGQSNNLHALWPSELLGLAEANETLLDAGLNSFNLTAWNQANSFNWVFSGATRAGVPPSAFLPKWRASLAAHAQPNRLVAWSGACSDTLGALQFPVDMLVQWNLLPEGVGAPLPAASSPAAAAAAAAEAPGAVGAPTFLRLFPAWPSNQSAAFTTLRMRGALLVSAAYDPAAAAAFLLGRGASVADAVARGLLGAHRAAGGAGGVMSVEIVSEAGARAALLSPWPGAPRGDVLVCALGGGSEGGARAAAGCPPGSAAVGNVTWALLPGRHGGDLLAWPTVPGGRYAVVNAASAAAA